MWSVSGCKETRVESEQVGGGWRLGETQKWRWAVAGVSFASEVLSSEVPDCPALLPNLP